MQETVTVNPPTVVTAIDAYSAAVALIQRAWREKRLPWYAHAMAIAALDATYLDAHATNGEVVAVCDRAIAEMQELLIKDGMAR